MSSLQLYQGPQGFEEFANLVGMPDAERAARVKALQQSFMPFKVTRHYAELILEQNEPYRTQLVNIVSPPPGQKPFRGRFDPYGNKRYRQGEKVYLQHKYRPTLLLHVDDFCISNCQFCYKVNEIRVEHTAPSVPFSERLLPGLEYIASHPEVNNILFTGGDPAAFRKTKDLVSLIQPLLDQEQIRVVRFATKGLAYDPERFLDGELLSFFQAMNSRHGKQVSIIAQINHPAEFSEVSCRAIAELQAVGVQVRGQPAVIRGVNDSVDTLIDLQRRYLDNRVISYYLTVFMPVRGVEQYGLTLDYAYRNVAESKRYLSGLEKKGVLLTSHDFGKFEIVGFYPTPERPRQIVLKWHEAAMSQYLPEALQSAVPTRPEDILILDYEPGSR